MPTRAQYIPAGGAVPIADASGKINSGWIDTTAIVAVLESSTLTGPLTTTVSTVCEGLSCDNYSSTTWFLQLSKSDGTRLTRRITALHNGTTSADATTVTWTSDGQGESTELTSLTVALNGTGTSQTFRLTVTMTYGAGTWTFACSRIFLKAA